MVAIFSNNGQQCLAGSRILVEKPIAKEFKKRFVKRVQNLRVGDPFDPNTEIGPLISKEQIEKVMSFSEKAEQSKDTKILCGGKRVKQIKQGYYFEPTVVEASDNQKTNSIQPNIWAKHTAYQVAQKQMSQHTNRLTKGVLQH